MLENQDQDLTLTDLSHNTLNYQLSQNLNMHQNPVMIKDILYYNYSKSEPQQQVHVINQNVVKSIQNQDIMSPSSNSSSSPAPASVNHAFKNSFDQLDLNNKSQKKSQKKKSSQATSEIDEERTSQLVSEILRNIKEKTKELESLNQNLKSTNITEPKSTLKLVNVSQNESEFSKNYSSQDSFSNELNDSNEFYDSDSAKSQSKQKKSKTKNSKTKSKKLLEIPQDWNRVVEPDKTISYISPTGFQLRSHQDIKNYLLSDQTCKCGLECPLNIYEVFNFSLLVETVASKKNPKNTCFCKHVYHGIKKQKSFVKVLDEVNQNFKRTLSDKKPTTKKPKINQKIDNHSPNSSMSQTSQAQNNPNHIQDTCLSQQHSESIIIPNFVLNPDSSTGSIHFDSNELLFDEKNFSFEHNHFNSLNMVILIL